MGLNKITYTDHETVITAENMNEIQDAIIEQEKCLENAAVVCPANGTAIVVNDSSANRLMGLCLYGKSTQDGTPTPAAPVDIVSVGNDGGLNVMVHGGNMAESIYISTELSQYAGALFVETTLLPATTYMLSFYGTVGNVYYVNENIFTETGVTVKNGISTVTLITKSEINKESNAQYQPGRGWLILKNREVNSAHAFNNLALNYGATIKNYETPKGEQTVSLTATLRGIPVTNKALATYTDANGQMWCADEINFERCEYVQRVKEFRLPTTPSSFYQPAEWANKSAFVILNALDDGAKSTGYATIPSLMTSHFKLDTAQNIANATTNAISQGGTNGTDLFLSVDGITNATTLGAWIAGHS